MAFLIAVQKHGNCVKKEQGNTVKIFWGTGVTKERSLTETYNSLGRVSVF